MDKRREKVIQKSQAFPSFLFVCKLFLAVNLNAQVKTDEFAYWSAEYASKTKKYSKIWKPLESTKTCE